MFVCADEGLLAPEAWLAVLECSVEAVWLELVLAWLAVLVWAVLLEPAPLAATTPLPENSPGFDVAATAGRP